jgi:hypothetical protein
LSEPEALLPLDEFELDDDDDVGVEVDDDVLESLELDPESFEPESFDADESFDPESDESDDAEPPPPADDDVFDRESLMYQPLPLKTMPTG